MTDSSTKQFDVTGMHCQACATGIERQLSAVPGVSAAAVTLSPPRAIVTTTDTLDHDRLQAAVSRAGDYRITPVAEDAPIESSDSATTGEPQPESLYPLLLIVGFIAGVTLLVAIKSASFAPMALMGNFMAGFFIVFGFFKLLDWPGFVSTYRTYDLIAKALPAWGWAYPIVEVTLGAAYLLGVAPVATNLVTLILMLVGAAGVGRALANKQRIRCACLGTVLNLPMTTVTLIEDLGMAAMAAASLLMML